LITNIYKDKESTRGTYNDRANQLLIAYPVTTNASRSALEADWLAHAARYVGSLGLEQPAQHPAHHNAPADCICLDCSGACLTRPFSPRIGYALSFGSALAWSTTSVLIKYLLDSGAPRLAVAFWRDMLIAIACLLGLLLLRPREL